MISETTAVEAPDTLTLTNGLEQSVMPSPNIVSIIPSNKEQHLTRLGSYLGTAAERYLLASRVRPWEVATLTSPAEIEVLRNWFLDSERVFDESNSATGGYPAQTPIESLPLPLARLLSIFGPSGQFGPALFAADLSLITAETVYGLPPGTDRLVAEFQPSVDLQAVLKDATPAFHHQALDNCLAVLAFSVVPARYGVLLGERGLRRALLETGTLLTNTAAVAHELGLSPVPVVDFSDVLIDQALRNDGVERTTIALLVLGAELSSKVDQ